MGSPPKPSAAAAGAFPERSKWPPPSTSGARRKASAWPSAASPKPAAKAPKCELLLKHLEVKGVILSGDAAYCMRTQTPVAMDVRIGLHEALFGSLYFALTVRRL